MKINKVKISPNYSTLKDYDFIQISHKIYDKESKIKLWSELKSSIPAISFYSEKNFIFLLSKKGSLEKSYLDKLEKLGADIKLANIRDLEDYVVANLSLGLYNSMLVTHLGSYNDGYYYIASVKKSQIVTLNFTISKDYVFKISVVTFSQISSSSKKPMYCFEGERLVPTPKFEKDKTFIKKNNTNRTNRVNFFNLDMKFKNSKIGVLSCFLDVFKYCKLEFQTLKMSDFIDENEVSLGILELEEKVKNLKIKSLEIYEYSPKLSSDEKEKFISILKEYILCDIKFVSTLSKVTPTIVILENKDFFKDNDPYKALKNINSKTQMIAPLTFKKSLKQKSIIFAIIKELIIKIEIKESKFWLTKKWEYYKGYTFYIPRDEYFGYKISFNGDTLEFKEFDLFDSPLFPKLKTPNIELIAAKDESYFYINKTNLHALPDPSLILEISKSMEEDYKIKSDKKTKLKRSFRQKGGDKELTYDTVAGIKYLICDNKLIYFASPYNLGNARATLPNASIIREVYFNKDFDKDVFLSGLNEYFIRNKQTTVLPFFMKYLREYVKLNI